MFNLFCFSPITYVQCQHFLHSGKSCIADLLHLLMPDKYDEIPELYFYL